MFGKEVILDLGDCAALPCSRAFLEIYVRRLCDRIDMSREDLHFWDYHGDPEGYAAAPDHLKGISLVQFIKTSSIVIHTIDVPQKAFINIFSCKDFDAEAAKDFTVDFFSAMNGDMVVLERS